MKKLYFYRYLMYGALFGLLFPIGATIFDLFMQGLAFNLKNLIKVQQYNSLHLIIDTAPLFLGLFASLAGRNQDKLQHLNSQLEERIKERTKGIQEAQKIAETATQAKSKFLSKMSHEIRTPIHAILGFSNLLLIDKDMKDEVRNNLSFVKKSADNLLFIVNDILQFSQIEKNKIKPLNQRFNLFDVMSDLENFMVPMAQEKGLDLIYKMDTDVPVEIKGDQKYLNQVLSNLIFNAIKFSREGKVEISISCLKKESDKSVIHFSVKDEGIGIDEDQTEHIFESFAQAYSEINREHDGAGLGLTIARKLVESMGGKLAVKSQKDKGSEFYFDLTFETFNLPSAEKEVALSYDLKQLKILVAEDNRINQMVIQKVLTEWNAEPRLTENGEEAITEFAKSYYDLVIMDLHMPQKNGFEAFCSIRKTEKGRHTPIIALSADVHMETIERTEKEGFNAFVAKPFNQEVLYKTIVKFLKKEV